jgi:integrase
MALTDTSIRAARARDRPYKLTDDGGLTLLVNLNGSKWWRLRYRFDGREKMLSLGVYPAVPLKRARERRDEIRRQVADGIDPSVKRRSEKFARAYTFEAVALEWLELHRQQLAPVTFAKKRALFEYFIFPYIGQRPIARILAPALLPVLKRIEARGIHETAHRARSQCGAVFRFAVSTGRAERDPTSDLRGALALVVTTNHPAITEPGRIGELLRSIDGYRGQAVSEFALKLAPLVFVRPGELRAAEWSEIDLDAAEWRVPAERMKMKEQHVVPLARQAVELLRNLHPLTGSGRYVFPSVRTPARPISENTVNAALRRLGYSKEEMTGHGFRVMASTCLNEQGWHPDLIELQLAHAERDEIRGAYNRAQRLAERRKMMQAWADYLDGLRVSTNVTPTKLAA